MYDEREVIWCICGAHMVSIEKETWGSEKKASHETYIQFWNQKGMDNDGLRSRIRHALAALRGELYHDSVCLNNDDVKKLIKALQKPFPKEKK